MAYPTTQINNIDTIRYTGFYHYASSVSGTIPVSGSGGVLIVLSHNEAYTVQLASPYDSTAANPRLFIRIVSNTVGSWVAL